MGTIRKQTIISSVLVYIGFLIGALNTYFYVKNGLFTPEQFGITRIFFDFAQNMSAFGVLGVVPVIYKFYPYYKDNLEQHRIDLITWGMLAAGIGFLLVMLAGWYFRPLFESQFYQKSPLIVTYYYWLFPFTLGMLFFNVLEGLCWAVHKTIISSFLKETVLRVFTLAFILLFYTKLISFEYFIYAFAFLYCAICIILAVYLYRGGHLFFLTVISRVTKKFWKKMLGMQVLVYSGTVITSIAATIDSFIIAKFQGLAVVGIFALAQYASNLVQVPQRSIVAVSAGVLSRAWKDKNIPEIMRIYKRSCISLLLMALFIFGNLWLNIADAIKVFDVQKEYEAGLNTILVLGMVRIIDAGTGLNAMVINTSTFWRFDFISGVILLILRVPLTYYLIKHYGIIGSAFAELVAYGLYNFIRFEFLRRKFNMQPFDKKTLLSILAAVLAFASSYFLLKEFQGWGAMIGRSIIFSVIMITAIFKLDLTPDATQLLQILKLRMNKMLKNR